jgi:regulator of sigma E protease
VRYLAALLVLGSLVAFHELGHLILARLFRIRVDRFAVGFGPPLVAFTRGGVEYSLRAIPIGGYVRIHGMNPHQEGSGGPDAFSARPAWQRALVLFAGSGFNYLLALLMLFALYLAGTHVPVARTIGFVHPASGAARAQLRPGDEVTAVDGVPIDDWRDFARRMADRPGRPVRLELLRGAQQVTVEVNPEADEYGTGRLGVAQQYVYRQLSPGAAFLQAWVHAWAVVAEGASSLGRLATGRGGVVVEGPIGIARRTSEAASAGMDRLVRLIVALSVALAMFNLLPVPSLDGGRLLLILVAFVRGQPLTPRTETLINATGFLALIALILWVAVSDVRRIASHAPPESATQAAPADGGADARLPP